MYIQVIINNNIITSTSRSEEFIKMLNEHFILDRDYSYTKLKHKYHYLLNIYFEHYILYESTEKEIIDFVREMLKSSIIHNKKNVQLHITDVY